MDHHKNTMFDPSPFPDSSAIGLKPRLRFPNENIGEGSFISGDAQFFVGQHLTIAIVLGRANHETREAGDEDTISENLTIDTRHDSKERCDIFALYHDVAGHDKCCLVFGGLVYGTPPDNQGFV